MKLTDIVNKDFKVSDFLGNSFICECGKTHSVNLEKVIIENGALRQIPELLKTFNNKYAYIVADTNTYEVAGKQVEHLIIEKTGYCKTHVYQCQTDLVPNEAAIGEFLLNMGKETDVIIAVGSGVLNDLCKFMSYKLGIPYIIVATAPSMDGYASDGAALIINNLKTTLSTTVPKAIVADTEILKNAPKHMIAAGFADMVGKYSAINDWKLSNIINGEYYCDAVATLVMKALNKCIENSGELQKRNDNAIRNLMEGLVLTGIAMSFSGNSRPASGSEHHLSHFSEMMYLFDGKEAPLHGIKVGVNTIIINRFKELLLTKKLDFVEIEKKAPAFDQDNWTADIKRIYRQAAPEVISLNKKEQINSLNKRLIRLKKIQESWEAIVQVLKDTPTNAQIEAILQSAEAPTNPLDIGLSREIIYNGLVYAKEVRNRYTVLQLAWDLGILDELSSEITDYYWKE